ncbi:hypothetical protein N9B44_00955 [bacterium]|nr:hypothetical protein [bacterium]
MEFNLGQWGRENEEAWLLLPSTYAIAMPRPGNPSPVRKNYAFSGTIQINP